MKRALAAILAMFLTSSSALATDYTVNFAIDMHGRQDTNFIESVP